MPKIRNVETGVAFELPEGAILRVGQDIVGSTTEQWVRLPGTDWSIVPELPMKRDAIVEINGSIDEVTFWHADPGGHAPWTSDTGGARLFTTEDVQALADKCGFTVIFEGRD